MRALVAREPTAAPSTAGVRAGEPGVRASTRRAARAVRRAWRSTHRSAVAFLRVGDGDVHAQQLTRRAGGDVADFDLSVFELFAPLSSGGAVVVADATRWRCRR